MSKKQEKPKSLSHRGKDAAARYLELMDFEVVERDWKCPAGKVDIVAWDDGELVFVKVKTRASIERGFPSERVTPQQRGRAEKLASYFLSGFDAVDIPVRFDVVALIVVSEDRAFVRHYKNMFGGSCC